MVWSLLSARFATLGPSHRNLLRPCVSHGGLCDPNTKHKSFHTTGPLQEALVLLRFVDRCLEDHACLYFDCVINLLMLCSLFMCFF
ncbi:BnaA08g05480D [Brassica napus]|uniref:BnaA08g05480D protein n=1 Tax=Brassica napus TaxID=3708 RepID=A0A078I897_BRANA|nr:BnaA08g05480D [Brassica napus]